MDNKLTKIALRVIVPVLAVILMIIADYLVKEWALVALSDNLYHPLIGDIFGFTLVWNEGMAWGMFQGMQWLFIVITPIAIAAIIFLYVRAPFEKKYIPARAAELMLIGGAMGNLVDRLFRGELFHGRVVDMFYLKCINFPVFNVADSFVSVGFAALVIMLLFVYKDEDFDKILSLKLFKKEDKADENN